MTTHAELRQVHVFDGDAKNPRAELKWSGWFHVWAGTSEYPQAVIEREDGCMETIPAYSVQFLRTEPK